MSLPASFSPTVLKQLELLRISTRRQFLGSRQGAHMSLKRGHGIEFSDYRKYELGDNPRHIDWGVYARSDRLYVKRYQEEQALTAMITLDTSRSMFLPEDNRKWERARDIALALSYIALMEQDLVILSAPGAFVSPALSGPRAIHTASTLLNGITLAENFNFRKEILKAIARVRLPTVGIFISDLLMPFEEIEGIINGMRAKNLDLYVIQLLGPDDLTPLGGSGNALAVDSETGEEIAVDFDEATLSEYKQLLSDHNKTIKAFLQGARIPYLTTASTEKFEDFITHKLPATGLVQ
ncbi:MAG: DUF58 domain-containing protein [Candidatus Dadabacteria bacterium]|nr:MAG: DUF58 domain-containing protein [Candidatus Dadabacteria bacterium]